MGHPDSLTFISPVPEFFQCGKEDEFISQLSVKCPNEWLGQLSDLEFHLPKKMKIDKTSKNELILHLQKECAFFLALSYVHFQSIKFYFTLIRILSRDEKFLSKLFSLVP
jgi:hypothetical protein